ncbi:hypothetical protein [Bradyrhizobium sp. Ec3.3]|uniref:hypothetical protein n=1 Tax=Bradyrhizobium sp. Ec3.3 TaxID=189753 RepID=UPI00068511F7|nr:hypothetical protein [Bradyrhizobium sp. Ec3.3]
MTISARAPSPSRSDNNTVRSRYRIAALYAFLTACVSSASPAMAAMECASGYVWRVAVPSDLVCVTPESRSVVASENARAASRHLPGSDTCQSGYVWREAYYGDKVCTTPERRSEVRQENIVALRRVAQ